LLTHIAAMESASLCVPMKSYLRFWNSERLFALAANCFDRLASLLPNSASLKPILNQAEEFPARFFASSGPAILQLKRSGKGKKEPYESID
jgi:hypothetical protein